jgi:hypothetical protein
MKGCLACWCTVNFLLLLTCQRNLSAHCTVPAFLVAFLRLRTRRLLSHRRNVQRKFKILNWQLGGQRLLSCSIGVL